MLTEKLKIDNAMEIITGVGLVGGAAIIGLAPSFWAVNTVTGAATLVVGAIFIVEAIAAKVARRSR